MGKGMKTVTVLKKSRALLDKGWTQGWFAKDENGCHVDYGAHNATYFCIAGAVYRTVGVATAPGSSDAMDALTAVAPAQYKFSLSQYNDAPRRTKAQVLGLFDRAIARLSEAAP